ncbi:MAG: hypothetical protein SF053_01695 [Bacteroidia bacterium]|nr:hypothetical protein [Bacteroidia bacterium]
MNRKIHIVFYRQEGNLLLYTWCFDGASVNETDSFFIRFKDNPVYAEDVQIIVAALKNLGRRGAEDRYLRDEDNASALPIAASKLRLYCIKGHKYCLLLGGGGIKSSQRVQDSPDAYPHFRRMNAVEKSFRKAIAAGDLRWDGDGLIGDFILEIDV